MDQKLTDRLTEAAATWTTLALRQLNAERGEVVFWRHPEDSRDFSTQPPSGKAVDEFVIKFQKPM